MMQFLLRPWLRLRQRQTWLCVEGWYYVVVMCFILGGAILREINLLIALFGMMAGPLLFNWRSVVVTLRGLDVTRKTPDAVRSGDLLVVDVEARNTRRWWGSWAIVVEDAVTRVQQRGAVRLEGAKVFFTHVPVGTSRKSSYQGRISRRGRYRLGPLRVTTRFPLGLVRRSEFVERYDTVTVYPRIGRLTQGWARRDGEAAQGRRRATPAHGTREGEYHGLRDFRSGDSQRWIHWRTSARRGQLMVRQFEQQRNQDLCLLVDLWQPILASEQDLENVELAVSFAATVISDRCRRAGNYLLTGTASHELQFTRGPASSAYLQDTMESLALAEATSEDRLPQLLSQALDEVRPGTSIVLVSTRANDLQDHKRFGELWNDPRRQQWIGRILSIDASGPQLDAYFLPE